MQEYDFEITICAASESEAGKKAQAGATLLQTLTLAELEKLAYIVRHDPNKREMARRFLGV